VAPLVAPRTCVAALIRRVTAGKVLQKCASRLTLTFVTRGSTVIVRRHSRGGVASRAELVRKMPPARCDHVWLLQPLRSNPQAPCDLLDGPALLQQRRWPHSLYCEVWTKSTLLFAPIRKSTLLFAPVIQSTLLFTLVSTGGD
jgi:hypothetical protein